MIISMSDLCVCENKGGLRCEWTDGDRLEPARWVLVLWVRILLKPEAIFSAALKVVWFRV